MTSEHTAANLQEMETVAKELAPIIEGKIVFLNGAMGVGKTTFVAYAATALGAENQAYSPTFSIANRYETKNKHVIHIDLYRLETDDELEMTGFWEIIQENATIFIEWADKFDLKTYIKKYVEINIDTTPDGKRKLTVLTT